MKHRNFKYLIVDCLGVILAFVLILFLLLNVFYPAYLSYAAVCDEKTFIIIQEQLSEYDRELVTSGYVEIDGGGTTDIIQQKIVIIIETGGIDWVTRHELVHVNQIVRGYPSLSCKKPLQKYLGESEAYFMQHLPNFIFYRIYETEFDSIELRYV